MTSLKNISPSVVTIGTFDGVHIGHQKIIKRLVDYGQQKQLTPKILTFFPHPRMVLQKEANIKLINTLKEKEAILQHLGINHLVVKKFTKEFSRLTAKEFVENILVKEFNTKHIIIGYDHRFGRNRTADINNLREFGAIYDFDVEEISAQDINNVAVSSTKIRNALNSGAIKTANSYLGYEFSLSGKVIKGKQIGGTIGFPTANLCIKEDYKIIPAKGVYVIKTTYNNEVVFGMMNIGINPTVNGKEQTIEIHLFNFNKTLYGEALTVKILHRLRDEQKFESLDNLKVQLKNDQENALRFLKNYESISI